MTRIGRNFSVMGLILKWQSRLDEPHQWKDFRLGTGNAGSFRTGINALPNFLNAASDCQTSTTRQPPGTGPAICASTPFAGQSASLFFRPLSNFFTVISYRARVVPGNSTIRPTAIVLFPFFGL